MFCVFFLMIRRPPRSTQGVSSAASDVYKRQELDLTAYLKSLTRMKAVPAFDQLDLDSPENNLFGDALVPVSYTHLRAHETLRYLVCRLLLEKKKKKNTTS